MTTILEPNPSMATSSIARAAHSLMADVLYDIFQKGGSENALHWPDGLEDHLSLTDRIRLRKIWVRLNYQAPAMHDDSSFVLAHDIIRFITTTCPSP